MIHVYRNSRSRIRLLLLIALLLATKLLLRPPAFQPQKSTPTPTPTPQAASRSSNHTAEPSAPLKKVPAASKAAKPPAPPSGSDQLQKAISSAQLPLKGKVIVVDAGHGGTDPGACMLGVKEAVITLEVALKLQKELERQGATVIMTRTDNKKDLELVDILTIEQNAHPDFFISVHVNSSPRGEKCSGIQTYYRRPASSMFAHTVHHVMLSHLGAEDKKVHKAGFYVINYDLAPSVLLEIGYITNTADRRKLVSPAYQQKLAEAITAGIIRYLEKKRQLVRLRKIGNLLYQPLAPLTL